MQRAARGAWLRGAVVLLLKMKRPVVAPPARHVTLALLARMLHRLDLHPWRRTSHFSSLCREDERESSGGCTRLRSHRLRMIVLARLWPVL